MGIILQNEWRNRAIFAAIIIMLISLFVSRAFLSVSIIVFLAITIINKNILSQMVYGDIAGWPGVVLFTFAIILPLFIKQIRHRFFWNMLVVMAIGYCLVETTLEIQFGIFIYCFTVLWWWKWLKIQNR